MRVAIYSGWTKSGGSTEAFIEITNALNEVGVDTTFYGPHKNHLSRCKSGLCYNVNDLGNLKADVLIGHFCLFPNRQNLPFRKVILSCHETNVYPLTPMAVSSADLVHLVSQTQLNWHLEYNKTRSFYRPYEIIPNIIPKISLPTNLIIPSTYAGVIGSIDRHKLTHISIERALEDKFTPLLFGEITDQEYFYSYVFPYVDSNKAILFGTTQRNIVYSMFSRVYHSSLRETFNYVKAECESIGMPYFGMERNDPKVTYWSKEDIVKKWVKIIHE